MDQASFEISQLNLRISELQAFLKCPVSKQTSQFINGHIQKLRVRLAELQSQN